jgi:hippurate hydrolase
MDYTWADLVDRAAALRHELHRRPELTWKEFETARRIRDELDRAGIAWRACAENGTVATLGSKSSGRHIALRADIDALPIHEATGLPYASETVGCMHACGHDGHTATLFSAAWWLKAHENDLPGPVTLLFQPAEEGGHGAKRMIEDGALEEVEAIFGWHNWPAIPFGKAVCPDGVVMAANGTFEIVVRGRGGHASQPEVCRDPVLAASAITLALQQIVSRRLAPQQAAVVSVTSIDAPGFATTTPDEVRMGGSIRLGDSRLRDTLEGLIVQTVADTAQAYGVTAEATMHPRYDATVNDPGVAAEMREGLRAELGEDWESGETLLPVMASEDFSYYLQACPGAFALLGSDDGDGHDIPCHSGTYDFNDRLIGLMGRLFARIGGRAVS